VENDALDLQEQKAVGPKPSSKGNRGISSPAAREAADMTMKVAKPDQRTTDRLFRDVFQQWSDLFVFTVGFFSSALRINNEAESQFLEAIAREAIRRGLLKGPKFTMANFNRESFTEGDRDDVLIRFYCGSHVRSPEDKFFELFGGRNRWVEREQSRRAQKLSRNDQQHNSDVDEDELDEDGFCHRAGFVSERARTPNCQSMRNKYYGKRNPAF
jgi:hypothetical protein